MLLPLAGLILTGRELSPYLEFPPRTIYVQHAPFSWPVFICLAAAEALVYMAAAAALFMGMRSRRRRMEVQRPVRPLPWWGRLAAMTLILSWLAAWTRLDLLRPVQQFTFIPLWFSYIFFINGLAHALKGSSMLTRQPGRFAALFPLSALFWWYFEYLNRFVQNWHYIGIEGFSSAAYAVTASVSFSTVLPAVLSTHELICLLPGFKESFRSGPGIALEKPKAAALACLLAAASGLALVSVFPDELFWLLWVSPLVIITGIDTLLGREELFSPVARGDWQKIATLAASGLLCGFLWEMWNWLSYAKWIYLIPYVGRFKIFEMPVLGYAGYLPFGLECWLAARVVLTWAGRGGGSS